jgi:hypothetical protein
MLGSEETMEDDTRIVVPHAGDPYFVGDIAPKVLTADGRLFVFTVEMDPKCKLLAPNGGSPIVFAIAANGPHSEQRTVQIRDRTAKPNKRFPWIIVMRTVPGSLTNVSGEGGTRDFGQGSVAVCTKCLQESSVISLLSAERTSLTRHAGRHIGTSMTEETVRYADQRVMDAMVTATVYAYLPACFLTSPVVLECTHGLGVGRDAFATLTDSLIRPMREVLIRRLRETRSLSIALDKWSIFSFSILGLAVVAQGHSAVLGFYASPEVVFNGDVAAQLLKDALRDFEIAISKIASVCSDSGGVERAAAAKILQSEWSFDMLHLVSLATEDMVKELKRHRGFRALLKELKQLAVHYHYSVKFVKWLAKHAIEVQNLLRGFPDVAWHPERIALEVKTRPLSK